MKTVQRHDYVNLTQATFTPEGFLRDCPVVTRTGIFEYRNADGSVRREFRPHDEVLKADSLQSYLGKPVTLKHPTEPVTADNAKQLAVGAILSEGKADGENIRADVIIYDKATIESGKRELSLGYAVDLDDTPGEYNGLRYDCIQRNIRINHLAIVDVARAGRQARLNLDGDQIFDKEDVKTMKIRLDNGLEYDAAPEVIHAYQLIQKKAGETQTKLDTVEAERDSLKAKVDGHAGELEKVKKDSAESIAQAVKARVALLKVADDYKIDKADDMTDRQLKESVIKAVRGDDSLDLSQKSDAYIDAAFDFACADAGNRADAIANQRKAVNTGGDARKDEAITASDARQSMIERYQNAYKGDGK